MIDYLRGQPGVQMVGDYVVIRGTGSFNSNIQPLYVINGKMISNDYHQANRMVDPNDIKSVKVVRDVASATAKYGMRGANGAIEITLKD